ncbi:MAG: LysE family translocator [Alphaproteobacteria bacterium]|nr:LysE family translocator [Rhodocyclaceae bacterium]MCA3276517.1 LysE family translocator [Roseomonas sp.]
MINSTTYIAFILAAIVTQITPGPSMMLVASRGVTQGWQLALCTAIGMTIVSGVIQVPVVVIGLASIFKSSKLAFLLLKWIGAVYLIWRGCQMLRETFRIGPAGLGRNNAFAAIRDGLVSNLMNPKPLIFMIAYLPQFVDPDIGSVTRQMFVLGFTQKFTAFMILATVALTSGCFGNWLARRPLLLLWQGKLGAVATILVGLHVLLSSLL